MLRLRELQPGDWIRHVSEPSTIYTVAASSGDRVTAVHPVNMTNADGTRMDFKPGDVMRRVSSTAKIVVIANCGDHVTGVQTADITHSLGWEMIDRDTGQPVDGQQTRNVQNINYAKRAKFVVTDEMYAEAMTRCERDVKKDHFILNYVTAALAIVLAITIFIPTRAIFDQAVFGAMSFTRPTLPLARMVLEYPWLISLEVNLMWIASLVQAATVAVAIFCFKKAQKRYDRRKQLLDDFRERRIVYLQ